MTPATTTTLPMGHEVKEGQLRKRGSRMRNWSSRYIILNGPTLSYKLKADAKEVRGAFDLSPGCIVTEVNEESMGIKGKKIFSFWIVWPQDKHAKAADDDKDKGASTPQHPGSSSSNNINSHTEDSDDEDEAPRLKDLKQIVASEVQTHKKQQQQVEEQIERHQAYDHNLSLGMKVAALSVGGVVIGALTAGVGLVPYITVVGLAAVAGGGAVALQFRKPSDSRLILAAESMQEAIEWKTAIERQIAQLEENRKPTLPPSANAQAISSIIGMSAPGGYGTWKCVGVCEGMRLLEQTDPAALTRCMKAQVVVRSTPVAAFLSLMDGTHFWPIDGTFKVVKSWDDHADIVGVVVKSVCPTGGVRRGKRTVQRRLCLSRFWKLDDDGIYLITLNSTKHEDFPAAVDARGTGFVDHTPTERRKRRASRAGTDADTAAPSPTSASATSKHGNTFSSSSGGSSSSSSGSGSGTASGGDGMGDNAAGVGPMVNAVITVAPRKDHVEYDDDLAEALVTVTVQTSTGDDWCPGELDVFLRDFLAHHLLEMKHYLLRERYGLEDRGGGSSSGDGGGGALGDVEGTPVGTSSAASGGFGADPQGRPRSPVLARQRSLMSMLPTPRAEEPEHDTVPLRRPLAQVMLSPSVSMPPSVMSRLSPVREHRAADSASPGPQQGAPESSSRTSGRVHGLIRRLGGGRAKEAAAGGSSGGGEDATVHAVGMPTWRQSPAVSPSQIDQTSQAVAAKRKMSLRRSLMTMSPFGSSKNVTAHPAPEAQEGAGVSAAMRSRSLSPPPSPLGSGTAAASAGSSGIAAAAAAAASSAGGVATGAATVASPPTAGTAGGGPPAAAVSTLKRKGRLFKEESSALRGQIAAKEYEVQRISKDLERKLEKAQRLALSNAAAAPSAAATPVAATVAGAAPGLAQGSVGTPSLSAAAPSSSSSSSSTSSSAATAAAAAAAASRPSVADDRNGLKILKTEISDASHNLQEQTAELGQLKAKYLALTGLPYEQSGRRKGALSRLRAFGAGSTSSSSSSSSSSGSSAAPMSTQKAGPGLGAAGAWAAAGHRRPPHGHVREGRLPSHWQPTRMERMDSFHVSKNTEADVTVNLLVVALFVLSMLGTMLLANVISLIK